MLASFEQLGVVLPPGYRLETGGSAEEDREAVGNLLTYAPVLTTIMMAAIILVFRSVRIAGILLVVAFLSIGMALLSTFFAGFPVSFNTILGTLGLIGIALNDSIVVLAAIRGNPLACRGDHEAILEEVMGCTRHVLSTTLTTMGGFLPLLIFIGGEVLAVAGGRAHRWRRRRHPDGAGVRAGRLRAREALRSHPLDRRLRDSQIHPRPRGSRSFGMTSRAISTIR